jgi:hypothetical protein
MHLNLGLEVTSQSLEKVGDLNSPSSLGSGPCEHTCSGALVGALQSTQNFGAVKGTLQGT